PPPRPLYVGYATGSPSAVVLPAAALGAPRMPLVVVEGGGAYVVIPAGARGTIKLPGKAPIDLTAAIASGVARPSGDLEGACRIALEGSASAELRIGAVPF